MNFKTTIGLDVGRSAVKVVANAGGVYFRDLIPSIVSPAIDLADEATAARAELDTVEVGGRKFFTGDTARLQGGASMTVGLSDDWTNSVEYLVLVKSALKRLAARGVTGLDDPYIVLGTPAKLFGAEKERLVARTQQVVAAEMKVIPQPMGAYCSFFQDQRGVPIKERQLDGARRRSWAVVEVGHFTTDFLLMLEGQYIERVADSCEGINHAAEHLVRLLSKESIPVTLLQAEEALRTKKVFHFGQRDVAAQVEKAVDFVVEKIMNKAAALLSKDVAKLDGVLLAGGGAEIIAAALTAKWPHTVLLDNPRMAVADGFCRFGMGEQLRRHMRAAKATV
jgi:plasmid segregation protein ParM